MRRTRDGEPLPVYTGGSQVNQLVLVNRGKRPLLLLAGEVVSGGKQDRIIGKDRIVPIGSAPLPLDVFCVEHGRWTGDSMNFSAAETMVHPTVREQAAVKQDQSQVWAAVRDETPKVGQSESVIVEGRAAGGGFAGGAAAAPPALSSTAIDGVISEAPTQSYRRIYQSPMVQNSVEGFADEMSRRFDRATSGIKGGHVVGVVVAFGDDVAWSDIFASSQLFETYWPKLLRSYVVEALTRPAVREIATIDDARDFLRPATGRIQEDTEPGVYTWREQSVDGLTQIELEALWPKPITLHWLRVAVR
jgi:ARG and Rhodanese-Phosphatase-superfamily-associated Protein domain